MTESFVRDRVDTEGMSPEIQDLRSESVMVQLAKVDGKLDLLSYQMIDAKASNAALEKSMAGLQKAVDVLESITQTLSEGAEASKETAKALALALKEADETRRQKDTTQWTPFARTIAALGVVLVAIGLWYQLTH